MEYQRKDREQAHRQKARENAMLLVSFLGPYLEQQFGLKKNNVRPGLGCTVSARTGRYDLYLRVTPPPGGLWDSETLVIARIEFRSIRKGHGRQFMTFLAECASLVGYNKIGIECTNESSQAFGERLGLQQHGDSNNMLGTVEKVVEHLTYGRNQII